MQVRFYATLRDLVGGKTAEIAVDHDITVRELLAAIIERFPGLRTQLLDENGNLYGHVHLFVNGRDAQFLISGLDTKMTPDDVVNVFPAVGGG